MSRSDATAAALPATRDATRAIGWMAIAMVSFSLMGIAGREAHKGFNTSEIIFWRGVIGVAVLAVILAATGRRPADLASPLWPLHGIRSVVQFGAQYSWLYALTLIPLAELFALEFTAPLWVAALAPLLLGERLTAARVAAGLIGFAGTLIVVRPGGAGLSAGTMFALASAVGFALGMICTKRLLAVDPPLRILFWMQFLQTGIAAVPMLWAVSWPDAVIWGWTAVVALSGLAAHFAMARAFVLADTIIVAPMDFLRVPLIAVVGWLVYAEPLNPWVLAGGAVILAANAINILGERRRAA